MGYQGRLTLCNCIFGIPLIDYRRASYGLLIGSGAGSMMAIMDASPRFRFAIDIDQCRGREDRLADWLRALDRNALVDLVALAGWFSISDPILIADALRSLRVPTLLYSGAGLRRDAFAGLPMSDTLADFLLRIAEMNPPRRSEGRPMVSAEPSAAAAGGDALRSA